MSISQKELCQYEDNFRVWYSNYSNLTFSTHQHAEIELLFCKKGSLPIIIDHTLYTLNDGDLLICGNKSIHSSEVQTASNSLEIILFDPEIILPGDFSAHETLYLSAQDLRDKQMDTQAEQLFSLVSTELADRRPYYQLIVSSTITAFWYTVKSRFPERLKSDQSKNDFHRLEVAISYIQMHYTEEMTLDDVSKIAGFSPSYFSQIFHRFTGISFVKYLQIVRVNAVIRSLRKRDARILDIALDNGFSNIRSFNRIFKKWTGLTPLDFSKKHKNDLFFIPLPRAEIDKKSLTEDDSSAVIDTSEEDTEQAYR